MDLLFDLEWLLMNIKRPNNKVGGNWVIQRFLKVLDNGIRIKDLCIKLMRIVRNIEILNIDQLMNRIKLEFWIKSWVLMENM